MKRSLSVRQVVLHPSALAVFSGLLGALIGFLLNLAAGGKTSQLLWTALIFAMLFSLSLTAWQGYRQEQTSRQWMTMLQEMVFQTYFLTLLADRPEISQLAQHRLGQVLKTLTGEQQVSMVQFFSHTGLPATFIGDALQGSSGLAGADLQRIELPQIQLAQADLSRVNLREANLSEANLSEAILHRADLSGANLSQASLTKADLRGVNLRGANLTGADLSESRMTMEKAGRDAPTVQVGARRYPALRANLSHALLTGARLREANLVGADLGGANLQGADLTRANLSYANVQGADLSGAMLSEAVLIGANVQGADLSGATLTEAALIGANVQGADLSGATLTWAILDEADVRAAKVTEEQLQTVVSGKNVKREPWTRTKVSVESLCVRKNQPNFKKCIRCGFSPSGLVFFTASKMSPRRENMTLFQRKLMLQAIRMILAATLACHEDDFTKEGVFLSVAEVREGRLKFPVREKSLTLATMGKGVSIACTADRIDWARERLGSLTREQLFAASTLARIQQYVERDGQGMVGPLQRYVCSREDLQPFPIPEEVNVTLVEREEIPALYEHDQFHYALSYDVHSLRPDVLASVAEHRGHVVGIAAASADCEVMWQIGVDILAEYQGLGIGKALVGTLTQALWKREIIPYYSTTVSHLQSRQVVSRLGYWPAWIESYTKDA